MEERKPFYLSKMFWFNILAAIVFVASTFGFADFEMSADVGQIAAVVASVINVVLRFYTKKGITL